MTKLYPPKLFFCQNPLFVAAKNEMTEMRSLFEKAVAEINSASTTFSNEISIRLYSLYKQATEGDIDMEPPVSFFDFTEKAKYEAWASLKGKSTKDAQTEYIMLVYEQKN